MGSRSSQSRACCQEVILQICKERNQSHGTGRAHLVSVAADGVGCDSAYIRHTLTEFLKGKIEHVALVDPLHDAKNFRYMGIIGGSCAVWLGKHVMDPGLLILAGVRKDLWRVKDWASDQVVTALASPDTVTRLLSLRDSEDTGSVAVMCATMFFLRLRLYAVNGHNIPARERITYIWVSMIFLTSYSSKSLLGTNQKNMVTNRRNLITETLGLVFAGARSDVIALRHTTTEPCEHTFGAGRSENREFTVLELIHLEEKRQNFINAVYDSGLQTTRSAKNGYQASFESFVTNGRSAREGKGGPVELSFDEGARPVVDQLWDEVGLLINSQVKAMRALLSRFSVGEDQSPFLREFDSVQDLLHLYQEEIKGPCEREEGDDVEGDGEGSDTEETSNEDQQLKILAEAIEIATEVNSGKDSVESEDCVANSASEAAAGKESGDDPHKGESSEVAKKFRKVMESETLRDVASACEGAMNALVLKRRESGAVGSEQKCKSLQGRWMEQKNEKEVNGNAGEGNLNTELRRDKLIKIRVGKEDNRQECSFRTLGQYTKTYNKWYPDDKCQAWTKNTGKGKFRVLARMVEQDPCFGGYRDVDPLDSHWAPECVYVLCDAKDITFVGGMMERDE